MLKLIICIVLSSIVLSQNNFGFELGYSTSKQNTNLKSFSFDLDEGRNKFITANIFYDIPLSQGFSIKTDLGFYRKGYFDKVNSTDSKGNDLGKINLGSDFDYIFLSPKLKYNFNLASISTFIYSGLSFNYLINENINAYEAHRYLNYKNESLSYNVGIGFQLKSYTLSVGIENDFTKSIDEETYSIHHNLINFKMGYILGL